MRIVLTVSIVDCPFVEFHFTNLKDLTKLNPFINFKNGKEEINFLEIQPFDKTNSLLCGLTKVEKHSRKNADGILKVVVSKHSVNYLVTNVRSPVVNKSSFEITLVRYIRTFILQMLIDRSS
jgi:hypothetical protein